LPKPPRKLSIPAENTGLPARLLSKPLTGAVVVSVAGDVSGATVGPGDVTGPNGVVSTPEFSRSWGPPRAMRVDGSRGPAGPQRGGPPRGAAGGGAPATMLRAWMGTPRAISRCIGSGRREKSPPHLRPNSAAALRATLGSMRVVGCLAVSPYISK